MSNPETTRLYFHDAAEQGFADALQHPTFQIESLKVVRNLVLDCINARCDRFALDQNACAIPKFIATLPNFIVAEILLTREHIINMCDERSDDISKAPLGIYQTNGANAGVYMLAATPVRTMIFELNPFATVSDTDTILTYIKNRAPLQLPMNYQKTDWFCVGDGILNGKTHEFHAFSPSFVFTTKIDDPLKEYVTDEITRNNWHCDIPIWSSDPSLNFDELNAYFATLDRKDDA